MAEPVYHSHRSPQPCPAWSLQPSECFYSPKWLAVPTWPAEPPLFSGHVKCLVVRRNLPLHNPCCAPALCYNVSNKHLIFLKKIPSVSSLHISRELTVQFFPSLTRELGMYILFSSAETLEIQCQRTGLIRIIYDNYHSKKQLYQLLILWWKVIPRLVTLFQLKSGDW